MILTLPLHAIFSSMGGLIVIHTILKTKKRYPSGLIDGVILQAPAIEIHPGARPSFAIEVIGRLLLVLVPKLPLGKSIRGKNNSPQVSEKIELLKAMDPLYYSGRLRIGTGFAILKGIQELADQLHLIDTPFLLQHGTNDRVVHVSGSRRLYATATTLDKTLKIYPNGEHDLLVEPPEISAPCVQDILTWLHQHIE